MFTFLLSPVHFVTHDSLFSFQSVLTLQDIAVRLNVSILLIYLIGGGYMPTTNVLLGSYENFNFSGKKIFYLLLISVLCSISKTMICLVGA